MANTLDSVRQAGGAGATALAQAALQSKRGVAISIEKQEANNQKLQAQGQLKVDSLKGQGELNRQLLQFRRDQDDLSELRNEADQLKAQEIYSRQQAVAGLGATFEALSSGIVPTQIGDETTNLLASNNANQALTAIQDDYSNNLIRGGGRRSLDSLPLVQDFGELTSSQLNASNLSEFYGGGNLPSIQERRDQFITAGLGNSYSGTADQNTALLEYLQNQ